MESSSKVTFFAHNYTYPEMLMQMREAKISFWNNKWTDIFDFTPQEGRQNFKIVTEE